MAAMFIFLVNKNIYGRENLIRLDIKIIGMQ